MVICCTGYACYSLTDLHPLREQLQRTCLYAISTELLFAACAIYSLAHQMPKTEDIAQALAFLGLLGMILGFVTLFGAFLRSRSVYWTLLILSSLVLLFSVVSSAMLVIEIRSGKVQTASAKDNYYKINMKIAETPILLDCISDLKEHYTISQQCKEVLQNATVSANRLLLVWVVYFTSMNLWGALIWKNRLGLFNSEVKQRKIIDLIDIGFTTLFVMTFFAGFWYMKTLESGDYKVLNISSRRLLSSTSPLASHQEILTLSQTFESNLFSSTAEPCSPLGTNYDSSVKQLDNGTLSRTIKETVNSRLDNGTCKMTETITDKYTYANYTSVSYITVKTTLTDTDGQVIDSNTINRVENNNTLNSPVSSRRRILLERPTTFADPTVSPSHKQGSAGGDYIWISCFTGFGESSLININAITNDKPTVDDCSRRMAAERPEFTLDKLRGKYDAFVQQNPGAV